MERGKSMYLRRLLFELAPSPERVARLIGMCSITIVYDLWYCRTARILLLWHQDKFARLDALVVAQDSDTTAAAEELLDYLSIKRSSDWPDIRHHVST
jgi:hypothetical protein